MKGPDP
jgi:hypothetical protein